MADAAPRFLVTAGNTREKIDRVRDWGNIFTGNTGLAIARALAADGEVDLLTSNRSHLGNVNAERFAHSLRAATFTCHAELRGALSALMSQHRYHAVFMTAAVADYAPAGTFQVIDRLPVGADGIETWRVRDVQAGKVKSNHGTIAILGRQTEKLVDLFRTEWGHKGLLVKFKLEVGISREELLVVGEASRRASGADYLVANTLDMVEGSGAGAFLLDGREPRWIPRADLPEQMRRIAAGATLGT